jgi:hypothetical protein
MTDDRTAFATANVYASGQPLDGGVLPPEQPPMDDDAGGPDADQSDADFEKSIKETSTDDLSVQGGA